MRRDDLGPGTRRGLGERWYGDASEHQCKSKTGEGHAIQELYLSGSMLDLEDGTLSNRRVAPHFGTWHLAPGTQH